MEELLVQAILADRAREAARVRHASGAAHPSRHEETRVVPPSELAHFPFVNWLRQPGPARR